LKADRSAARKAENKASEGFDPLATTAAGRDAHRRAMDRMREARVKDAAELFERAIGEQVSRAARAVANGGGVDAALSAIDDNKMALNAVVKDVFASSAVYFAGEAYNKMTARKDFTEAQMEQWLMAANEYIVAEGAAKIVLIDNTTKEMVQKVMQQAISEGWGADKAARELRKKWDDLAKFRAERIARTEMLGAGSFGTRQGALATGLTLEKVWISFIDTETRDSHVDMDGEQVPLDSTFSNGLMYPGDPSGPASEIVNCRCAEGYISI